LDKIELSQKQATMTPVKTPSTVDIPKVEIPSAKISDKINKHEVRKKREKKKREKEKKRNREKKRKKERNREKETKKKRKRKRKRN